MSESTARHDLPLIAPGQAQKEMFHNEALAALDLLVQPAVVGVGGNTPPSVAEPGACWIVGPAPTGAWTGHAQALAGWTDGGWRFAVPADGTTVWTGGATGFVRYVDGTWTEGRLTGRRLVLDGEQVVGARAAAIPDPAGGTTVDSEARVTLAEVLAALRSHGLIAA